MTACNLPWNGSGTPDAESVLQGRTWQSHRKLPFTSNMARTSGGARALRRDCYTYWMANSEFAAGEGSSCRWRVLGSFSANWVAMCGEEGYLFAASYVSSHVDPTNFFPIRNFAIFVLGALATLVVRRI